LLGLWLGVRGGDVLRRGRSLRAIRGAPVTRLLRRSRPPGSAPAQTPRRSTSRPRSPGTIVACDSVRRDGGWVRDIK